MLIKYRIFILLSALFLSADYAVFAQDSSVSPGIEEMMAKAAEFNKRMEALIEKYKNADARKDAEAAFRQNNLKFISIMGYVPGTDDAYPMVEQYGTFNIPDTGDVILSQKHGEFQVSAREYAWRYNDAMISLIKKQKNKYLAMMIESGKQDYQAGENIELSVSLENTSGREVIVYWNNDTPLLRMEEKGAVLACMQATKAKDFEILRIKPKETLKKRVRVKSDALSGDVLLALQYSPMELKMAQQQDVFKEKIISNRIALRVTRRAPDILDVECMRALSIGAKYITSSNLPEGDFKLIKAENMVMSGSDMGPHIWHLTYKANDLMERGGKGGEIFLEVDMNTQEAKLLGYGE